MLEVRKSLPPSRRASTHDRDAVVRVILLAWALAHVGPVSATPAVAQPSVQPVDESPADNQPRAYYYDPDGMGAHAFYNPQNFMVQGALGAMYDESVDTFEWGPGVATLNRSLASPIDAVNDYGWSRFFYREFVPHLGEGQNYAPNWIWHFAGGGMRTKLMLEYYTAHGFELPALWAWLTMYSYHYVNEAVQAARFAEQRRSTIDPIADMYFFDWAGGLLFQLDAVNRVMGGTLHMREWSYQAQFDPFTRQLLNNGQLYWLRVHVAGPISLSFLTGEQISSVNVTYGWSGGRQLSVGAGPKSKTFIARPNGDTDPVPIIFSTGIFYSVNDNPLVTFTYDPRARSRQFDFDGRYLLNVYPGPIRWFDYPMGITLAYQEQSVLAGFTFGVLPASPVASTP